MIVPEQLFTPLVTYFDMVCEITAAIVAVYVLSIFWYLDSKKIILSENFLHYEKAQRYEHFKRAIIALTVTIILSFFFKLSYFFTYPTKVLQVFSIATDICLLVFGYHVYLSLRYAKGRDKLAILKRKEANK